MKLKFIYTAFVALLVATLFMGNSNGRAAAGGGNSTQASCSGGGGCHKGATFQAASVLSITGSNGAAATTYTPGATYDVTYTIDKSGGTGTPTGYGFQLTASNAANKDAGTFATFTPAADVQKSTLGGRTFIEQNKRSTSNKFTMKWTAPAKGTGAVTFFAAGNAVNGAAGNGGDAPTATVQFSLAEGTGVSTNEMPSWATAMNIAPNPATDYALVQIEATTTAEATISVFDLSGKKQIQFEQKIQAGQNYIPLEINTLATGVYMVAMQSEGKVIAKKMVVR